VKGRSELSQPLWGKDESRGEKVPTVRGNVLHCITGNPCAFLGISLIVSES
jgi:hypothetical protein